MTDLAKSFKILMDKKQSRIDKGKEFTIRDIAGGRHKFICEKFISLQQSNNPEKYFIFEKWVRKNMDGNIAAKNLRQGDIEYRISYYIVSRKNPDSNKYGKWYFGESAPLIPVEDFEKLIEKARNENVIIS